MRTWLVKLRDEKTQEEMAKMLGISQQMYCAIEAENRNPRVKRAKEMAQVLGVPWTKFFESSAGQEVS